MRCSDSAKRKTRNGEGSPCNPACSRKKRGGASCTFRRAAAQMKHASDSREIANKFGASEIRAL